MRAIDADAMIDRLKEWDTKDKTDKALYNFTLNRINEQPTIQPEIVRCEYCKHRDPEDKKCDCGHDILWQLPRRNDWFCADGER